MDGLQQIFRHRYPRCSVIDQCCSVIVFYFVSFGKLNWVGWYNTPLEGFVHTELILLKIVLGSLLEKLPFSLILFLFFSLAKQHMRMISQIMISQRMSG